MKILTTHPHIKPVLYIQIPIKCLMCAQDHGDFTSNGSSFYFTCREKVNSFP